MTCRTKFWFWWNGRFWRNLRGSPTLTTSTRALSASSTGFVGRLSCLLLQLNNRALWRKEQTFESVRVYLGGTHGILLISVCEVYRRYRGAN